MLARLEWAAANSGTIWGGEEEEEEGKRRVASMSVGMEGNKPHP